MINEYTIFAIRILCCGESVNAIRRTKGNFVDKEIFMQFQVRMNYSKTHADR